MLTWEQLQELDPYQRACYLATGELMSDDQLAKVKDSGLPLHWFQVLVRPLMEEVALRVPEIPL